MCRSGPPPESWGWTAPRATRGPRPPTPPARPGSRAFEEPRPLPEYIDARHLPAHSAQLTLRCPLPSCCRLPLASPAPAPAAPSERRQRLRAGGRRLRGPGPAATWRRCSATPTACAGCRSRFEKTLRALPAEAGASRTRPDQKQTLLTTWAAFFDYFTSTEVIRQRYWDFVKVPAVTQPKKHAWGFLLTHGALTTELAHGLAYAELTSGQKQLEVLLDEPAPEYGMPRARLRPLQGEGHPRGHRHPAPHRRHLPRAAAPSCRRRACSTASRRALGAPGDEGRTPRWPGASSQARPVPSSPRRPGHRQDTHHARHLPRAEDAWPSGWATPASTARASRSSPASRCVRSWRRWARATSWWRGRTGSSPTSACRASGRTRSCTWARRTARRRPSTRTRR